MHRVCYFAVDRDPEELFLDLIRAKFPNFDFVQREITGDSTLRGYQELVTSDEAIAKAAENVMRGMVFLHDVLSSENTADLGCDENEIRRLRAHFKGNIEFAGCFPLED